MKRPLRAILSSIFALFKDAKSTKRPFRARLSPFLASAGHEKAVPCDAVAIFGLPKTRNCRFPRNGLRFLLFQDKKRPFRSRLSSFFALQSTKKAVPCDTVAIFSLKKPFRAILSRFFSSREALGSPGNPGFPLLSTAKGLDFRVFNFYSSIDSCYVCNTSLLNPTGVAKGVLAGVGRLLSL